MLSRVSSIIEGTAAICFVCKEWSRGQVTWGVVTGPRVCVFSSAWFLHDAVSCGVCDICRKRMGERASDHSQHNIPLRLGLLKLEALLVFLSSSF